jgi:hypothetical protein
MTDLTKILKAGDKVWYSGYGEKEVAWIGDPKCNDYPIGVRLRENDVDYLLLDGRISMLHDHPIIYPLDQKPAPPQWPEVPKTFEWEGEIYTEGEWVAVRAYSTQSFTIVQLATINDSQYPIKCSDNWVYSEMRKLHSFNQPEESSRKEKEDALAEYLHEEYDIVLGSQQISEIFHLIEKK